MTGAFLVLACLIPQAEQAPAADLILHNGKIATIDAQFRVCQAIAIRAGRILRLGDDGDVLKTKGERTQVIDLQGKFVIPGLIDSHVHPDAACLTEFDHVIPDMESIADVLKYIEERANLVAPGEWINVRQVFITRLKEQRYPTRAELDRAAPRNPVLYATGPDASLNSLALKLSGIDQNFRVTDGGAGFAEKDAKSGAPTGILRNCTRYVRTQPSGRQPTDADRLQRLLELFRDYNSVGLTGIIDRDASPEAIDRYRTLYEAKKLPLRIAISHGLGTGGATENIQKTIRKIAEHPLRRGTPDLRIIGVKIYLDGGMLTGSAYMRQPWGVSSIYAIDDPGYRGLLFVPQEKLTALVQTTVESGLQFTAHSVGDGAVHALLDAYREVNARTPVRKTRPCITHSNFMSKEAIETAARLGTCIDIQPAWLYLDTRTLVAQFGYERLRYFQPLKSIFAAGVIVGGGSDHMQKIGSLRSTNPYSPFLAMWTAIVRRGRWYDGQLHPEEALTREQALRFYTINNAQLMFLEDQVGSLEAGKFADLAVLDRDLLTCPIDDIRSAKCLETYVSGKRVFSSKTR